MTLGISRLAENNAIRKGQVYDEIYKQHHHKTSELRKQHTKPAQKSSLQSLLVSCASDDRKDAGICFHKNACHPHRCVQQRWKSCNLSCSKIYSWPQTVASYGWPAGSTLMSVTSEAAWDCYQNVCPYLSSSGYASRGQHVHQDNNMHRQP